jgi:RNA polymerase sigma-70 factor (ECF subfamily)
MNPRTALTSYIPPLKGPAVQLKDAPEGTTTSPDAWAWHVGRAAAGDADALAQLYDGTVALVYGLALRILRDRGGAEEITEDVYMQVWRQAARYDATRGSVARWLLTLTRSRAIDRLRGAASQRERHTPLDEAAEVHDTAPGPEHEATEGERRNLVRAALARLSVEQREAIELAYFRGMSHSEIATRLGAPLGTVKTRIRLAMDRLRMSLGDTRLESR